MSYLSLINKIQQGGADAPKTFKTVYEKDSFSRDCILMIGELCLQKSAHYGEGNEEGNLYKGIVMFMVVGLKKSIPFAVQPIPEIT